MVKKSTSFIGIFMVLLMSFAFASAVESNNVTLTSSVTSITNAVPGATSDFVVTVENNNASDFFIDFGVSGWTWNTTGETILSGETKTYLGTLTIPASGNKNIILNVHNDSNHSQEFFDISQLVTITYAADDDELALCENGDIGDLELSDISFNNLGEGDDEEWYPLDEIEIEVEVENTDNNDDVDDVMLEIYVFDRSGNDVTNDFDFEDESIDLGDIKDDDYETATFKIKELPADIEEDNYEVYFKAYADRDEDIQCVSESNELSDDTHEAIEVTREDDPAVIVKDDITVITVECGAKNVELPLNVYNLGSDKEDKVLVTLENSFLGLDERTVIDDLRAGKRKEVVFFFDTPENPSRDRYDLEIKTYFDYDKDEDELDTLSYDESSDDIDKDRTIRMEILECKAPAPTVRANLETAAEVGSQVTVKATVTNNGETDDFVFSVSEYESWANIVSVTPQTATIAEGQTQEVTVVFEPTGAGTKTFKVNSMVDGETYYQQVAINVGEEPGVFGDMDDITKYLVVGIIILVVLIFLVLIIKALRRKTN